MNVGIADIRVTYPHGTEIEVPIQDLSYPFEAELHGENRMLGNFVNFRAETESTLVFDFESTSVYGDQFVQDFRAGRVLVSTSRESIEQDGDFVVGFLNVQIMGCLSVAEPPTTACDECGKVFPAWDAYRSTKWENRLVCPDCYRKGEDAGRMKLREGEEQHGVDTGTT